MQKEDRYPRRILTLVVWLFALWLIVHYWDQAMSLIGMIFSALAPLILGFAIAYVLNILLVPIENRLSNRITNPKGKKFVRPLGIVLSFLVLIAIIAALGGLVVPKLWSCFEVLARQLSNVTDIIKPYVGQWISLDFLNQADMQNMLKNGVKWLLSLADGTLESLISGASAFFSSTVNVLIAIVLSVYLLSGKEKLLDQISILMEAYLPKGILNGANHVMGVANQCFHNYIVGQSVEAVILGSLCCIGMLIFQMPYAAMIGSVVGATALIPFVGAYIGAAVGAVLILTVSPIKALLFLVFLVVLQQLESNLIYPHVVGSSVGLPGMWVLIAIAIGGSFGGVVGIVLSVPVMATVYQLVKEVTESRRAEVVAARASAAQGASGLQEACIEGASESDAPNGEAKPASNGGDSSPAESDSESAASEEGDEGDASQKKSLFDELIDAANAMGSAVGLSNRNKKK